MSGGSRCRPSRVCANRHPTSGGESWGWVEAPGGEHALYWSGATERAMAASRANELDRVGWEHLAEDERRKVKHGALGDCRLLQQTRGNLGAARERVRRLREELSAAQAQVERCEGAMRVQERAAEHGVVA